MATRTVELAPGVVRLPLLGDYINAFAFLESDGSVTLVDCGLKRAPATIDLRAGHHRPADPAAFARNPRICSRARSR
ncbi:MAG: hypothetical protein ACKOE2_06445, partial [Actinomycetales bacterium]